MRKAVELDSEQAKFRNSLGKILSLLGDGAGAESQYRKAVTLEPKSAGAWNNLGELLGNRGRMGEAVDSFRKALVLRPKFVQALSNLAFGCQRLGQSEQAIKAYKRLLSLHPRHTHALHNLGLLYTASGQYRNAADCFDQLVKIKPENPAAHTCLGVALQYLNCYEEAKSCYLRAIELQPDYADAHSNLGTIYQGMRDFEASMASFKNALAIDENHTDAIAGVAALADWQGEYEMGLEWVAPHVTEPDANPELQVIYARLLRRVNRQEEAIVLLEGRLERADLGIPHQTRLHFILGDLYDDLGHYDKAFEHYHTANTQKPVRFDPAAHKASVDDTITVFTRENLGRFARIDRGGDKLVFIVGMPRSGTSLVEQILASHPEVHGAGELEDLANLAAGIPVRSGMNTQYPVGLERVTPELLDDMASDYLANFSDLESSITRVTDKTPGNFIHLGLIEMMFPGARIIHCQRHPMDTALSNYFQNFAGPGISFSYDLEHIKTYYTQYRRVMEHWHETSNLQRIDLRYEDLVRDQERLSRQLVEFVGLEWHDDCLRFHESKRVTKTASHAQVRKPIYTSSVARYHNYEKHLGVLKSLGDDY